jgi:hypothetical protein
LQIEIGYKSIRYSTVCIRHDAIYFLGHFCKTQKMFNYIYNFLEIFYYLGRYYTFYKVLSVCKSNLYITSLTSNFFTLYFDEVVEDWTFPGWDTYIDPLTADSHKNSYVYIWRHQTSFVDKQALWRVLCYDGTIIPK